MPVDPSQSFRRPFRRTLGVVLALGLMGGVALGQALHSTTSLSPVAAAHAAETVALPSFADIVDRVSPAVVNIQVTSTVPGEDRQIPPEMREFFKRFFGQDVPNERQAPQHTRGLGSGFVISPDGYIVTNNHVAGDADEITVTFQNGEKMKGKLVGADSKTDLALVKVDAKGSLPYVEFGDSAATRVGDWVLAVGNPFGLDHTVTAGILSARGRSIGNGPYDDFLQIDAPINQGNSGGPTFNLSGQVIGINTAIFSPTGGSVGIGFAIPANQAKEVIAQLREHGSVQRGWLGVVIQEVNDDIARGLDMPKAEGAVVSQVQSGSPAAKAGVKAGDVIVAVNGDRVEKMRELPPRIARLKPGERIELTLWRDGRETTVRAEIAKLPEDKKTAAATVQKDTKSLGLALAPLDDAARRKLGLGPNATGGAVVTDVDPGSPAAQGGLQPGDTIIQVERKTVSSPAEVVDAIKTAQAQKRKSVLLLLGRDGEQRFVALPLRDA